MTYKITIEPFRRAHYPGDGKVTTLFVGESPPHSGDFFYVGNTMLKRSFAKALGNAGLYHPDLHGDFLQRFKQLGFYLDDLVLDPVNTLEPAERRQAVLGAQKHLAERIAKYQPQAVVSIMYGPQNQVRNTIEAAVRDAGSAAKVYAVPFPGRYGQRAFQHEMADIIHRLPRHARNLP